MTFDRRVRKDAFYFYKANWNTSESFVHLADSRVEERFSRVQTVRVFSNGSDVELFVNGASQGLRSNDGLGRFEWKEVTLRPGENLVEAVDPLSGARDRSVWVVVDRPVLPGIESAGGPEVTSSSIAFSRRP